MPDCADDSESTPEARPARAGEEDIGRAAPPMSFNQDVRRALTPRVKVGVLVCILIALGAAPLIGGPSLFASLGLSGAAYIKVFFWAFRGQDPLLSSGQGLRSEAVRYHNGNCPRNSPRNSP